MARWQDRSVGELPCVIGIVEVVGLVVSVERR
jgi:hypothetical protein